MENLFDNTILIVEDAPENIDILVKLLRDFDMKIAKNGKKALEIAFEGSPPDLILLDILMPGMDGYEVCRRLRANKSTQEVPIIFLTVKSLKDEVVKGFEVGGQDYVTKPFDSSELMERVKTQLELKSQREILKNMNNVLERKVMERTTDLQNALSELDKARKELEGLNTAKNNFLHMISHEIRTPLNGIVGATYILQETLKENVEFKKCVNMLQFNVDRLEEFSITALLITQIQSDYYKPIIEPFKVKDLIKQCVDSLSVFASEQNVKLIDGLTDLQLEIYIDKDLVLRGLKSVIHNAIKYSPENSMVVINVNNNEGKTIIEVIDKGDGFCEEALMHLFKPFWKGQEHADCSFGLSLYATKMIMKIHKGDMTIENHSGSGAKVALVFNN